MVPYIQTQQQQLNCLHTLEHTLTQYWRHLQIFPHERERLQHGAARGGVRNGVLAYLWKKWPPLRMVVAGLGVLECDDAVKKKDCSR